MATSTTPTTTTAPAAPAAATTATAAKPAAAPAPSTLDKDITAVETYAKGLETKGVSWLKAHERIIITALVLTAGSWFGDHWLNNVAAKDKQTATIAAEQLQVQQQKDNQIASEVTSLQQQYQAVVSELSQKDQQLDVAMTDRTSGLEQQQTEDKVMPLPELGSRWATLAGLAPSDISATAAGIAVTQTGALDTVDKLEQVPVLTQNLSDEKAVATNQAQELEKANTLIGGLNQQVSGLTLTVADDKKACTAEIASVKAADNKAKSRWFKFGFIGGFITGFISGHKL